MQELERRGAQRGTSGWMGAVGWGERCECESGFTLIELMVVLLIMAILLAIAIPTFLSVTNGAKRTATQSDLTDTVESATALYIEQQGTFTTGAQLQNALRQTQTTITYVAGTTAPAAGRNSVSLDVVTGTLVVFSAIDGSRGCWFAADNESHGVLHTVPAGNEFGGEDLGSTATLARCTAGEVGSHLAAISWQPNFATVPKTVP